MYLRVCVCRRTKADACIKKNDKKNKRTNSGVLLINMPCQKKMHVHVGKCLSVCLCIYIYIALSVWKKVSVTFFWVYIILLYNYMLVFLQCKILSKIIRKEFGTFVSVTSSSSIL